MTIKSLSIQQVQNIAAGDQHDFSLLFDMYSPILYAFSLRMTRSEHIAQEVVQEVFFNIWKYRERLVDVVSIEAYLISVAKNVCFQMLKAHAREWLRLEDQAENDKFFIDHSASEQLDAKEGYDILEKAIAHLTPKQKEVYLLCRVEGHSYQQAADYLKISPHTVHFHMKEALKAIRKALINSGFPAFLVFLLLK